MSLVSIVIPVYQSARSLSELMERLRKLADEHPDDPFEFVFVDDGSTDDSWEILKWLAAEDSRIRVVKLSRNFGSHAAVLAGLSHADGDAVAAIASDLQDPPELIGEMLAHWKQGHKVVIAARASRNDPVMTRLLSSLYYGLFRRFAIRTMPRQGFDFFLIDRQVRDLITGIQENNAFLMGQILWLGFDLKTIHYHRRERERRFGVSTWTMAKKLKLFADSFIAFSSAPIRLATLIGTGLCFCGLLSAVFVVGPWLAYGSKVEGWAALMVAFLIVSGTQMIMLGILGEYVWRTLDETRRRPRFVVDRIMNRISADVASRPSTNGRSDQRLRA